ncbi:hypothetical protein ACFZBM_10420 [Streptomyces lavendulae]|uniref:Uncharacterized protein n=1 Tax=Streptomyces lavendulae subsp. lavendulae TaxID=58340 RepID=A0A2K8PNR9_STRLA|nr:hypothetical protein [Streptomyces lavendulae]ATZ28406.1 hypothetical protein SLAV_33170 [Streptomyces lavendulae subsp. lavendulae]QUQ58232.1 hypothetical protein SLLC_31340 [Streptomyces lavendulae subsp. lavendulae]
MNRHARYALLTPLLVSAVAMPSTLARAAATSSAPAAVPRATCALVAAPNTNPQEFDLTLTGFRANQSVRITGPEKFTLTTNGAGAATNEDVTKGTYNATVQGNNQGKKTITCTKPARTTTTAVHVTDVDVSAPATSPEVDCSVAQSVTFTGKISGTGTGDVDLAWTGSNSKTSSPTVKFAAPNTAATPFTVKSTARSAPSTNPPQVFAQLNAGKASDSATFKLKCKAGT